MAKIKSVAVFCGASAGHDPIYREAALELGGKIAKAGMRLVYGGGHVGLMGAIADGALEAGGEVIGVIPEFLTHLELAHNGLTELILTDDMHTRKRKMFEMSDAFITFAGGMGTMDETFEILTWRQLRLHDKPILICDVEGSSAPFDNMMRSIIATGFARPECSRLYEVTHGVDATMARLAALDTARSAAVEQL